MSAALTGAWQLQSWTARLPRGGAGHPFGERPNGVLVYTADGTMCSSYMQSGRERVGEPLAACRRYWQGLRPDAPPGEPETRARVLQAVLRFNSYAGRYAVEGDRVHHAVEVAMFPDWIGLRLTRRFVLQGDTLSLSFGSPGEEDTLVWTRR
jgi:hypothetical protein